MSQRVPTFHLTGGTEHKRKAPPEAVAYQQRREVEEEVGGCGLERELIEGGAGWNLIDEPGALLNKGELKRWRLDHKKKKAQV